MRGRRTTPTTAPCFRERPEQPWRRQLSRGGRGRDLRRGHHVTPAANSRLIENSEALAGFTIVTGVAGDDIHVMGIRLVEHALRSAGAQVVSLGVMTPVAEFVEAAIETAADAVVLSSSNGHAAIACDGIRELFIEAGIGDMLLYIGGNLYVGRAVSHQDVERQFKILGFDRVFEPGAGLGAAFDLIAQDINARRK
jgi:methylaspartate mutase sigma subunit